MRTPGSRIRIGLYGTATGSNAAAWRHPDAVADLAANLQAEISMARMAERGLIDFLFLADSMTMRGHDWDILAYGSARYVAQFEPLTLLSALAAATGNIGLVATLNTSYEEPYSLARRFASLDLLSGGRAGWNLVTSSNAEEAHNFSRVEHPAHADRYRRAEEFADVVLGLWNTWDDGAFVRDKQSGLFFDPEKLHLLNHKGEHFSVRGPLNVPYSPQRHPVMVQAGASEAGRALAGRMAEVIFCDADTIDAAKAFYADIKARVEQNGRRRDDIVIMPGVSIYVAATEEEAARKREEVQELINPIVGRDFLQHMLGDVIDLSGYSDDDVLPLEMPRSNANTSAQRRYMEMAQEGMTIREIYTQQSSKGRAIIGTPAQIADDMQQWFEEEAADGFIFMMDFFPNPLEDFVTQVVPELQRRGLYRTAYPGTTLRETLGLRKPPAPRR